MNEKCYKADPLFSIPPRPRLVKMVSKQEDLDFELFQDDLNQFPSEVCSLITEQQFEELKEITILPGNFSDLEMSPARLHDETTMDVAEVKFQPVTKYGPPERNVFSGELNFEIQVNASDVHRRKYLYSSKMNRIYVDMNTNFSIQFVWDFASSPWPMYVRATTVFSDEAQQEKRVDRCLQHKHSVVPGQDPSTISHVLRSTREAGGGVFYCGAPARPDSWLSVLVQPPPPPAPAIPPSHAYMFVCKNSCSTGINRRAIAVLFTLEDSLGNVLGRQSVGARVCACPRRDMMKDEETEGAFQPGKKRVAANRVQNQPTDKKIKIEVVEDDQEVYTLPAGLQIVGARTLSTSFNVMINMMEQAASYKKNDPAAQEKYNKAIAGLRSFVEKVAKDK